MASAVNIEAPDRVHAALAGADAHGDTVRINRKTRWGNSFRLGGDGDRAQVIEPLPGPRPSSR